MSEPVAAGRTPGSDLRLLTCCRAAQLRNLVDQQLREAPGRSFIVLALLVAFWAALYVLLWQVLKHVHGWGLVGVVADQHLFIHFFLVLAVMLLLIVGGLSWCFYRAVRAANKNAGEQRPDEV